MYINHKSTHFNPYDVRHTKGPERFEREEEVTDNILNKPAVFKKNRYLAIFVQRKDTQSSSEMTTGLRMITGIWIKLSRWNWLNPILWE